MRCMCTNIWDRNSLTPRQYTNGLTETVKKQNYVGNKLTVQSQTILEYDIFI